MNIENIFNIHEAFKLTDNGIPSTQSTWPRVSLSTSNLLCAIHRDDKSSSLESMQSGSSKNEMKASKVTIVNANGKVVSRSRTIAEAAKIHPSKPIIALKSHNLFQVYNFETKNLLSEVDSALDVCFWCWANEDTIMLVTEMSVYQWQVFTERGEAEYVCHRLPRLNYTEVVNCAVDTHHRWYTVTGLIDQRSQIEGVTQVYSAQYGVAQCIEAHTVTLIAHKYSASLHESVLLCTASRQLDSVTGKVHTIELGSDAHHGMVPRLSSADLKFLPSKADEKRSVRAEYSQVLDFPVSIQADTSHCVLYIVSKFGRLFIAELESSTILSQTQICSHITFCSSLDSLSSLTVVNKASQVLRISIDWLSLIKQIETVLKRPELARRLQNSRGMENVDLLMDDLCVATI
ncbi:clathrin heavy chain-like [Watersipora subatra]|uniref:clathrin heavy chain-like n=1 Tax=Watersipora subatra TaxID=2589382 RepID=UPI00355AEDF1